MTTAIKNAILSYKYCFFDCRKGDFLKQSKGKKNKENTALLYVRLSRDDDLEGDSYSIQNQKILLTKIAKEKGYTNLITFSDDGISGVTMNRPGLQDMLKLIESGKASAVFVKDMSRLGRNYIEVGKLTEEFFPEYNIRLVAVSDNIDTDEGENELAPIRNLFNEWYSRDISKKQRIHNKIKGSSGVPMGQPPYGYMKDSENPKHWIVDPEAAAVVRRIFNMSLDGCGTEQIATTFSNEHILTPVFYWADKGINRPAKPTNRDPHKWNNTTIIYILGLQEYCGDVINFKTYSKSYKDKKRIPNDKENMLVFKDVHEPIIDRLVWEKIQQKRGKVRKRCNNDGEKNMFSGILRCGDCGHNLHFHFSQTNPDIKFFNCSNYKGNRGTCTSTHYVRVDFLEQVILGEIRRLTKFLSKYEDEFLKTVIGHSEQVFNTKKQLKQKELNKLLKRDREIDTIIENLYEDNVLRDLSDERFIKMSKKYEQEQSKLAPLIKSLKSEIKKEEDKGMHTDNFIAVVRKYTRARKLKERMLNELIDYIEVYHAEKIDGVQVQKFKIHYNCIGLIDIPNMPSIPEPEVLIQTRKGVAVSYSSSENVVNL